MIFAATIHLTASANEPMRILLLSFCSLLVSLALTPFYTTLAYRRQWWKKSHARAVDSEATVYAQLQAEKPKRHVPTMAGLIIIVSVALVTIVANLSRSQTWLPLAGMVASGVVGLLDDVLDIRGTGGMAGMRAKTKFGLHSLIALIGGWWFYTKLGVTHVYIPGLHDLYIGVLVIVLFWLVVIATANAVNITDGLDGLAGGLLISSFMAYAIICGVEGKGALAAFCMTIVGALFSYTWFNINPARFFMGDVGAFALGTALGVIAMQTNTIYVLPVIGAVYVAETGSVIINRTSRKLRRGKKVFLSSPIHYHFEALGWPETKVTMRFWIIGQVAAVLGLALFLVGKTV